MADSSKLRQSSRLVIVTAKGRALLFHFRVRERSFWATPGGGLEPGEDFRTAAKRELLEETGIADAIRSELCQRETTFAGPDGQIIHADERYFAVRVSEETLRTEAWEAIEREVIDRTAWLSPEEIRQLTDPVYPEDFADLVEQVHSGPI